MSTALTPEEKQEVFGSFDPDNHNEEVKSRWGNTDAYKQSAKKTANYTKEDFAEMNLESDFIIQVFKNLMEKETSPERQNLEERKVIISEGIDRSDRKAKFKNMRNYSQIELGGDIKRRQEQFFDSLHLPSGKA